MPIRHLSETDCARIVTLLQENHSQRYVANQFGVSPSVINRIYSRFRETGSYHRRPGQGRLRESSAREDRMIVRQATQNRFVCARRIADNINYGRQHPISTSTVRNRLREARLRACRPVQVPYLTHRHRRLRLHYAHFLINRRPRQWSSVLFTDESRFCLFGNDRRARVWRRRGERYSKNCNRPVRAFHGGSVMVWAGISRFSRTPLVVIPPPGLTSRRYVHEILQPYVLPIRNRIGQRFRLVHDNARPHTARYTQQFLRNHQIETLLHPPMSPDLNPIEHVWDMLERQVRENYPNIENLASLVTALCRTWQRIRQRAIRRCINMQNRLRAVIFNRGRNTHY